MVLLTNKTIKYAQEEIILNGLSNRVYNVSSITNSKSFQIREVLQYKREFWTMLNSRLLENKKSQKDHKGLLFFF